MANSKVGTRPKSSSNVRNVKQYQARRAATDVQTGYGRDSSGRYNSQARIGSKLGRSGQIISRRQRYYDMRLAFGLAGG